MNWLPAVLVLGGLICLHELGHFFAARAAGVEVEEFSLGFGPRLLGVRRGRTLYALRLLPVLGYVRMAGMYPAEEDGTAEAERSRDANERGVGFLSKPLGSRVAVIAAGPLANFAVALALFAIVFGVVGLPTAPTMRLGVVEAGMPAAAAGLRRGDLILAVNGVPMRSWEQLHTAIVHDPSGADGVRPLVLTVGRGGHRYQIRVTPTHTPQGLLIGVIPELAAQRLPWAESLWQAVRQTGAVVTGWALALWSLIHGSGGATVMGPIGIGNAIDQASQTGLATLLLLAAVISANLGLLNLLPLPALDGGRLAFLGAEWVRGGRRVDPAKEGLVHMIGLVVMVALIIFISARDISHLG